VRAPLFKCSIQIRHQRWGLFLHSFPPTAKHFSLNNVFKTPPSPPPSPTGTLVWHGVQTPGVGGGGAVPPPGFFPYDNPSPSQAQRGTLERIHDSPAIQQQTPIFPSLPHESYGSGLLVPNKITPPRVEIAAFQGGKKVPDSLFEGILAQTIHIHSFAGSAFSTFPAVK